MFPKHIELESETIKLIPLSFEHEQDMIEAASDGELWNLWYTSVPHPEKTKGYIEQALKAKEQGNSFAFAVLDKTTNKVIGSTRFCNADANHKRLEIGYTWYAKSYQGTSVNTECKLLLLGYAFETLQTICVQFLTNWHNQKSRNAILRLGAKQDGVLRNHRILSDGTYRDTVVFSIIENEWPAVKVALGHKLNSY